MVKNFSCVEKLTWAVAADFKGIFPPLNTGERKKGEMRFAWTSQWSCIPSISFFLERGDIQTPKFPNKKKRWRCSGQFTSSLLTLYLLILRWKQRETRERDAVTTKFNSSLFSVYVCVYRHTGSSIPVALAIWNVQVVSSHCRSGGSLSHRSAPCKECPFCYCL